MQTLSRPADDEIAYRDYERSVLAMLATRYCDIDPDGRRELYQEAWASVLIALGGTSYAVATGSIGTKQIKNNSVRSSDVRNGTLSSRDVKRGSLGGRSVKESSLGKVPRASSSDRVGGKSAGQLRVSCPGGTFPTMGICIEASPRPAAAYGSAKVVCEGANRRLPSYQELVSVTDSNLTLSPGGELTSHIYPQGSGPDFQALIVTTPAGSVGLVPDRFDARRQFRCVAYPSN